MAANLNHAFPFVRRSRVRFAAAALMLLALTVIGSAAGQSKRNVPDRIPPKRSSQIENGLGGVNTSLPRNPYIPWNRWWWTRMFDSGLKWARIGQYEDTSDITGWDWIEQKRGEFSALPELDDYIDSLIDNGIQIQLQLLYGNPMYTSPAGRLPDSITPTPASVHNRDMNLYSVFWPPKTPDQITAFVRYTKWMVNRFRGRIHYYALWNEPDITYWNPDPNAEEYGRLLGAFAKAVHETDPDAKVVYGGQATLSSDWTRAALGACQCASGLDVFNYHTYPGGYSQNTPPESMDYGAFGPLTPTALRAAVRSYPGIRPDIQFWDDEFNALPDLPRGNDETVQAKYVTRGMLYNWAIGVTSWIWELINDTSSSEGDNFGIIHGMMFKPTDFTPRLVCADIQNLDALFSDTEHDNSIEISSSDFSSIQTDSGAPVLAYGFRSRKGKAVVGFWLAAHSWPHNAYVTKYVTLTLKNTGIEHPVLASVHTGEIKPLEWKPGTPWKEFRCSIACKLLWTRATSIGRSCPKPRARWSSRFPEIPPNSPGSRTEEIQPLWRWSAAWATGAVGNGLRNCRPVRRSLQTAAYRKARLSPIAFVLSMMRANPPTPISSALECKV
jgi:hypothetical protein